jgi:hypothetical protein
MDQVADTYPFDTEGGGCYFTRAEQRTIRDPEAEREERLEKVIVTDRFNDYEGRICIGEATVRHWAQLLGMYDRSQVVDLLDRLGRITNERDELATGLAHATRRNAELEARAESSTVVYVLPDGRMSTSTDHVAGDLGLITDLDPRPLTDDDVRVVEPEGAHL